MPPLRNQLTRPGCLGSLSYGRYNLFFESAGGNSTALQLGELSLFIDLKQTLVRKKVHLAADPAFVGSLVQRPWTDLCTSDRG